MQTSCLVFSQNGEITIQFKSQMHVFNVVIFVSSLDIFFFLLNLVITLCFFSHIFVCCFFYFKLMYNIVGVWTSNKLIEEHEYVLLRSHQH